MAELELDRLCTLGPDDDRERGGPPSAHDHTAVVRVRAEQMVWVGVTALDEQVDFGHSGCSSSDTIARTGIGTHSGRWPSS